MKIISTKDIYMYTHKNIVNFIDYKRYVIQNITGYLGNFKKMTHQDLSVIFRKGKKITTGKSISSINHQTKLIYFDFMPFHFNIIS